MPTTTRDVTARGIRTRVVESGSGTPLVLLHGFLSSHRSFDDVREAFSRSFHVIAVDLPGFGDSEKPPPSRYPYSHEAFSEAVTDVIAALGVGRCHLLGHGLGGAIALTLAAEHPEFVDHLVLIAPQIYPLSPFPAMRLLRLPLLGALLFKQVLGRNMFRSYFQGRMYASDHHVPISRIDSYFLAFNSPAARESAFTVMQHQTDTRASIARLGRVRAPCLVVWGRADAMLAPMLASRTVRQLPVAQLEFIDSGHSPHEETPVQFVTVVEQFLLGQRR